MGSTTRSTPLDILIVGAGIGGLGAAIALVLKGHNVTVLEAKPALNEFGASIGINANGTKVLKSYGLEKEFKKVVTVNKHVLIRDGLTNKDLGFTPLNVGKMSEIHYGDEIWNIHRADYQKVLAVAATSRGAKLVFNADVTRVVAGDGRPVVYCDDGTSYVVDLVVGADGQRSNVRQSIPKVADVEVRKLREQCWRATVPKDKMRGNSELEWLLECGSEMAFVSHDRYILSWPQAENRPYDVVCCMVRDSDVPVGLWGVKEDPKVIQELFSDFCPEVVELLKNVDMCIKWTLAELPPLPTCRSDDGTVVLLGDAFHAMIPHSASGGNSAIEDGGVLAQCIDWAHSAGRPISDATEAYEKIRKPRVERMQEASREGYGFLNAGGDAAVARNEMLRAMTDSLTKDLARPEADRRKDPKPPGDMHAKFPTLPYRQWLNSYHAVEDTKVWLAENMA